MLVVTAVLGFVTSFAISRWAATQWTSYRFAASDAERRFVSLAPLQGLGPIPWQIASLGEKRWCISGPDKLGSPCLAEVFGSEFLLDQE